MQFKTLFNVIVKRLADSKCTIGRMNVFKKMNLNRLMHVHQVYSWRYVSTYNANVMKWSVRSTKVTHSILNRLYSKTFLSFLEHVKNSCRKSNFKAAVNYCHIWTQFKVVGFGILLRYFLIVFCVDNFNVSLLGKPASAPVMFQLFRFHICPDVQTCSSSGVQQF